MLCIHTGCAQNPHRHVVAFPQKSCQQVLRAYVIVTTPQGILHGDLHHPLGAGRQSLGGIAARQTGAHASADDFNDQFVRQAGFR